MAAAWAAASVPAQAAIWEAAWQAVGDAALRNRPGPDSPFIEASRTFFEILRGGAFFFWIAPDAVHVVLATIRTQKAPRLAEGFRGPERTVSRLHCENGLAVEYEDGSGLYFWNGIQVPDHVILRPDLLRVDMILNERNAEVRRVMIERYGQDRFVLDAHPTILDKWKDNELLSIDLPDGPDRRLVALKLRCPSTAAVYILRVPPDQRTVQGALAWSFDLDRPQDYDLRQES